MMLRQERTIAVELNSLEIQALADGLSMTGQIADELGRKEAWRSAMDKLGNAQRALSIEVPHRNTGVTPQWRRDAFAGDPTGGNG